jgi:FemAB-related protein (PEP-CTERM system-associated)
MSTTSGIPAETSPVDARGASDLAVSIHEETDAGAWDRFLATQPRASFYHLSGWRGINQDVLGHRCFQLVARSGGHIAGALPLVLVSSPLFGRILCSMPFVNFGGPVAEDDRVAQALIRAASEEAKKSGVDYLELRCAAPLATDLPASLRKISMTISLAPDPDTLWNAFTSKHRKNVKRAYKDDLLVKSGGIELLPQFYALMQESWRNLGTPLYSRKYFEAVLRTFPDSTRIFVCHRRDEPVAVALTGYFNGVVEGLWAGGGLLARKLDANYVLYWEMIRDACLRGCRSFHLGRSSADSGGEEFKRKWNAEAQQLYWYFHRPRGGEMPALNVDNPKYRLAISAWRRLPIPVTGIIGPPLARLIP